MLLFYEALNTSWPSEIWRSWCISNLLSFPSTCAPFTYFLLPVSSLCTSFSSPPSSHLPAPPHSVWLMSRGSINTSHAARTRRMGEGGVMYMSDWLPYRHSLMSPPKMAPLESITGGALSFSLSPPLNFLPCLYSPPTSSIPPNQKRGAHAAIMKERHICIRKNN